MKPFSFTLLLPLFLFYQSAPALAANKEFFIHNDKWEKANSAGISTQQAMDSSFESVLKKQQVLNPGAPPPQPILRRTLFELSNNLKQAEVELNQTMLVNGNGIIKFVSTDEGIVSIDSASPDMIQIVGRTIGRTFVHVWDGAGRNTFSVQVTMPKFVSSPELIRQREALDKTRGFEVEYNITHGAFYTADKYQELNRTSSDIDHLVEARGDTPYGYFRSRAQAQRFSDKTIFSDMQARLEDGKIGEVDKFNAALGDSSVGPNLMVFPEARVRGVDIQKWGDRYEYESFYGREQSSIIGVVAPAFSGGKRTQSSFLSGNTLQYKVNEGTKVKAGVFTGHGRARADDLNRKGVGLTADSKLNEHFRLNPEVDFDGERFAQKHALYFNSEKLKIKNEVRDISKKFETMIGSPTRQGELGGMTDLTFSPTNRVTIFSTLDVFRDRLIPNPDNPYYWNFHKDARLIYVPWDRTTLTLNYQDYDDTGRIGPTKQRTMSAQLNQQFNFFTRKVGAYARLQHRENRILNNSSLNYERYQLTTGLQTKIFWDVNFSIEKEWSNLEEPNIRSITHPEATTITFDYRRRLWDSPFYMDTQLRMRDEEETESFNSFMRGEDSIEISGGLYYREYENIEIFITGSYESFESESRLLDAPRVEVQFLTGARYLWDTGYSWSTEGSFDGFVFKDLNGDGERSGDEPGIAGLKVQTGTGQEALTDAQGYYEFPKVSGKKTSLTLQNEKIPYGYVPTNSVRREVEIVQGKTQQVDYGLTPRSEVSGIIYNDLNGNGKYDLTDKGVRKVKITLDTGGTVKSSNSGTYTFSNVLAGQRTAVIDLSSLPEGFVPHDVPKKSFELFEGLRYELHFPLRAQRAVSGQVFTDNNRNTAMDAQEKPVPGVKVMMGSKSVQTDAEGYYLFDELNSGPYVLTVDPAALPSGYTPPDSEKIEMPLEPSSLANRNIGLWRKETATPILHDDAAELEDPQMTAQLKKKISPPVKPVATEKSYTENSRDTAEDILRALDEEEPITKGR